MPDVVIDQASLARARALLAKYSDASLSEKLQRGALQATRILVGPIKAAAPIRTGKLAASVKASTISRGADKSLSARVGPMARYRHLVIRPHRIVTPGGRDTGQRTAGNPFVDAAVQPREEAVVEAIAQIIHE